MKLLLSIRDVRCPVCEKNDIDIISRETFFPSYTYNKTDDIKPFKCPKCKAKLELHFKTRFEIKQKTK